MKGGKSEMDGAGISTYSTMCRLGGGEAGIL